MIGLLRFLPRLILGLITEEPLHANLVTDYILDIHTAITIIKNQVLYNSL